MPISDTVSAVATKLRTLVIPVGTLVDQPSPIPIVAVYEYVPDVGKDVQAPCFMLNWSLRPLIRSSAFMETILDLRMQLFVYDLNNGTRAAHIATEFADLLIAAFNADITLQQAISHSDIEGGTPTLVGYTWNGKPYVGLDMHLITYSKEIVTFG